MSRRPSTKRGTMSRPKWPDSHNSLSGKPGTIQIVKSLNATLPLEQFKGSELVLLCQFLS
jgi:hypothetical protein